MLILQNLNPFQVSGSVEMPFILSAKGDFSVNVRQAIPRGSLGPMAIVHLANKLTVLKYNVL
jgi:hypothetical protein